MGIAINNSKNNRRRERRFISEINVTPMVDVMLVLLIIFMITSPMLVTGIEVDLPEADTDQISNQTKPLVVSLNKNNEIYLFETLIPRDELILKLQNITKEKKDTRIFIKGDKNIPYGQVMDLMSYVYSAGFTKVALISDMKKNGR